MRPDPRGRRPDRDVRAEVRIDHAASLGHPPPVSPVPGGGIQLEPFPLDLPAELTAAFAALRRAAAAGYDDARRTQRRVDVGAAEPIVGGVHGSRVPVVHGGFLNLRHRDELFAVLRQGHVRVYGDGQRGCVHLPRVFLADPVPVLEDPHDRPGRPELHDAIEFVPIAEDDRGQVPHETHVALGRWDGFAAPSNFGVRGDASVLASAVQGLVQGRDAESVAVALLHGRVAEQDGLGNAVVLCAECLGPAHRPGLALDRELVRLLTPGELPLEIVRLRVPPPRVRGARQERQERQREEGTPRHTEVIETKQQRRVRNF